MEKKSYKKLINLKEYSTKKVLVIGDLILDKYEIGDITRISPEAPVPIFQKTKTEYNLGGAGNVYQNLLSLQITPILFSVIGEDSAGEKIEEILLKDDDGEHFIIKEKSRMSTIKTRLVSQGQHLLRIDQEEKSLISVELERLLLEKIKNNFQHVGAIIISDYQKGLCTPNLVRNIIKIANEHLIPVLVDSKATDYSIFKGAFIITPNLNEASKALNKEIKSEKNVQEALIELNRMTDSNILITRSADGMSLYENGKISKFNTIEKEVYDVSGAGDTVISTLAFCIINSFQLIDAIFITLVAAGIVIEKTGTKPIRLNEILTYISAKVHGANDIYDTQSVLNRKSENETLVFTNGCFDILHLGHLKMLEQSKELGDFLVVGLNSDNSVKRLKGSERPINSEVERAKMLLALRSVDAVIIFDEDTPETLIKQIKPNILVKGADYKIDEIVGADFVQSYGGEVRTIDLVPNKSTTSILMKVKENNR